MPNRRAGPWHESRCGKRERLAGGTGTRPPADVFKRALPVEPLGAPDVDQTQLVGIFNDDNRSLDNRDSDGVGKRLSEWRNCSQIDQRAPQKGKPAAHYSTSGVSGGHVRNSAASLTPMGWRAWGRSMEPSGV